MKRSKVHPGRERGAVAVEFALVAPMLLLIVVGIMEFSNFYNLQISVTQAAREAAREMAVTNNAGLAAAAGSGWSARPRPLHPETSRSPGGMRAGRHRHGHRHVHPARPDRILRPNRHGHRTGAMRCERLIKLTTENQDTERGAAGVLVAVMMLVLIGVGAIAVDVGQIYAERAELQNAADAGALAGAQICSETAGCTQADADAVAALLANQNSKDGVSNGPVRGPERAGRNDSQHRTSERRQRLRFPEQAVRQRPQHAQRQGSAQTPPPNGSIRPGAAAFSR